MSCKEFFKPKKYLRLIVLILVILFTILYFYYTVTEGGNCMIADGGRCGFFLGDALWSTPIAFAMLFVIFYIPACIISFFYNKGKKKPRARKKK